MMRVQAVLTHLMKTCFMKVDAMFPNHKLEHLSESQCEAMFILLTSVISDNTNAGLVKHAEKQMVQDLSDNFCHQCMSPASKRPPLIIFNDCLKGYYDQIFTS